MTTSSPSSKRKNRAHSDAAPKIPRPSNSFMLYRKDKAKGFPKLVAAKLSAKIAEAWRRETPEVRERYERLAEEAKERHRLLYPNYKFTPKKRGTGKRAQANRARLEAADSVDIYPSSSTTPCPEKRSSKRESASISLAMRPNRSKKQRHSPYAYPSESSTYSKRKTTSPESASLYLCSRSAAERTRPRSQSSQLEDAMNSLKLSEAQSFSNTDLDIIKHGSSDDGESDNIDDSNNDDDDGDNSNNTDEEDNDKSKCESECEENTPTSQVPQEPNQLESKEESTLFTPVVLPLLASEPFEPECLANAEWRDTMSGHCSSVSVPALTSCSAALLIEPPVIIPYEIYFYSVQRSLIMPRFAPIQIPGQPRMNQDLVMSPGLAISTSSFQDALRWLGTAIGPERF
ncbi:hypothetical protein BGZ80_004009 [Entomortierella chlamydospora]|uniref:HMG box domain-containing protein n=1 Tax=Entomortierella chlamydospora TaxID=101097 RepID=A0A9P6MNK2_9FUNG|nr:hypothetical protein BGZ80_004009 [Entomortierella chlamydospora]